MTPYTRYAIYFVPQAGAFYDFGSTWLGRDVVQGAPIAQPAVDFDLDAVTRRPRKYGFHATIKAPFVLAQDATLADLRTALAEWAVRQRPIAVSGLALNDLGGCLALRPEGDSAAVTALAFDVVQTLDPLRAPLTDGDMARRRKARLTPHQDALMQRWGYPFVADQFRFHMTLTSRLREDQRQACLDYLTPRVARVVPQPLIIDALALMGEDAQGDFHLLHRQNLWRAQNV